VTNGDGRSGQATDRAARRAPTHAGELHRRCRQPTGPLAAINPPSAQSESSPGNVRGRLQGSVTQIPDGVCRSESALYLAVRRPPQSMVMTVDGDDVGRAASRFRAAGRGRRHYPERLIEAPPARFELAHPAPEADELY